MELNKETQVKVVEIFRRVYHGRITFFINPEKKTLNYTIENSEQLNLEEQEKDKNCA